LCEASRGVQRIVCGPQRPLEIGNGHAYFGAIITGECSGKQIWDEYQWERFLQLQDRNTEKYFGLLEKYLEHPDRDNIIAKEDTLKLHTLPV
jgi:hypothetical protein